MSKPMNPSFLYVDRRATAVPPDLASRCITREEWLEDFLTLVTSREGVEVTKRVTFPFSPIGLVELQYVSDMRDFPPDEEVAARALRVGNLLVEEWLSNHQQQDEVARYADTIMPVSALF